MWTELQKNTPEACPQNGEKLSVTTLYNVQISLERKKFHKKRSNVLMVRFYGEEASQHCSENSLQPHYLVKG